MRKLAWAIIAFNVIVVGACLVGLAQEAQQQEVTGLALGLKALGAGLAFLGGALGTGLAQSRIGAAVMGAIAEDPKNFGTGIILVAIPETLVILGFVAIFLI